MVGWGWAVDGGPSSRNSRACGGKITKSLVLCAFLCSELFRVEAFRRKIGGRARSRTTTDSPAHVRGDVISLLRHFSEDHHVASKSAQPLSLIITRHTLRKGTSGAATFQATRLAGAERTGDRSKTEYYFYQVAGEDSAEETAAPSLLQAQTGLVHGRKGDASGKDKEELRRPIATEHFLYDGTSTRNQHLAGVEGKDHQEEDEEVSTQLHLHPFSQQGVFLQQPGAAAPPAAKPVTGKKKGRREAELPFSVQKKSQVDTPRWLASLAVKDAIKKKKGTHFVVSVDLVPDCEEDVYMVALTPVESKRRYLMSSATGQGVGAMSAAPNNMQPYGGVQTAGAFQSTADLLKSLQAGAGAQPQAQPQTQPAQAGGPQLLQPGAVQPLAFQPGASPQPAADMLPSAILQPQGAVSSAVNAASLMNQHSGGVAAAPMVSKTMNVVVETQNAGSGGKSNVDQANKAVVQKKSAQGGAGANLLLVSQAPALAPQGQSALGALPTPSVPLQPPLPGYPASALTQPLQYLNPQGAYSGAVNGAYSPDFRQERLDAAQQRMAADARKDLEAQMKMKVTPLDQFGQMNLAPVVPPVGPLYGSAAAGAVQQLPYPFGPSLSPNAASKAVDSMGLLREAADHMSAIAAIKKKLKDSVMKEGKKAALPDMMKQIYNALHSTLENTFKTDDSLVGMLPECTSPKFDTRWRPVAEVPELASRKLRVFQPTPADGSCRCGGQSVGGATGAVLDEAMLAKDKATKDLFGCFRNQRDELKWVGPWKLVPQVVSAMQAQSTIKDLTCIEGAVALGICEAVDLNTAVKKNKKCDPLLGCLKKDCCP
ncbi:unnamed protein product [Amoebophrya sp. A25]|nr:unnamed protein product [Amoebophrya sp. A25]|eukprot:GSA25T00007604001.1